MPAPSFAGFESRLVVGLAELAVTNNPNLVLTTYSLGSCLGIALYDPIVRVGGLLHAMLPDSGINPDKAATQPGMFLDTGLPALFRAACQLRADMRRMRVYAAGGAQILDDNGYFNIGKRNYQALLDWLRPQGLCLAAQHVGGLVNRTLYLHLATGQVRLKVSGQTIEQNLCNG